MPTSATGRGAERRAAAAGFTLLELMVVVAIVGILVSLVQIRVRDRGEAALTLEAQRFVAVLEDCRQAAVLSAAPNAIRVTADGWARLHYRNGWRAVSAAGRAQVHHLSPGLAFEVSVAASEGEPVAVCLPSGEVTVAAVRLLRPGHAGHYEFAPDLDGAFVSHWRAATS